MGSKGLKSPQCGKGPSKLRASVDSENVSEEYNGEHVRILKEKVRQVEAEVISEFLTPRFARFCSSVLQLRSLQGGQPPCDDGDCVSE